MDFQERRLAQIVRDFMEAYVLEDEVARRLEADELIFASVQRLVGDSEDSALYRLKEETHALFRFEQTSSKEELQAEQLFDLAVGALFHEAMRFREGYYLTTTYGPRLEGMLESGAASGRLAASFRRVFEAGHQRMRESAAESRELFDETRDQLLIVLEHVPRSRAVARSLVEQPERTERVFGVSLDSLLASVYGSAAKGYQLAVSGLIASGHFGEAAEWMGREQVRRSGAFGHGEAAFALGMQRHYEGYERDAIEHLERWISESGAVPAEWRVHASRVIDTLCASDDPDVADRATEVARSLKGAQASVARTA